LVIYDVFVDVVSFGELFVVVLDDVYVEWLCNCEYGDWLINVVF